MNQSESNESSEQPLAAAEPMTPPAASGEPAQTPASAVPALAGPAGSALAGPAGAAAGPTGQPLAGSMPSGGRLPALAGPAGAALAGPAPMRSVHTSNFGQILRELGISLFVSTYQAGKLVILRPNDEGGVNTHFRGFRKPMGVALAGDRMAIGTGLAIQEFHNAPAVAAKLDPPGKHDACFLPRITHITGDIQIHEMNWIGDELWFINTRFSCLCTRSTLYSFVPRWRPWFVSELAPEDRCHLNGMGLFNNQIRFLTALGETDKPGGWRDNKKSGGILIDLAVNKIIARGLSMPHSPRWYAGKLWVLNSGDGGIGTIDLATGAYTEVARCPGFTRGLDFFGPLAFIGLSQIRESAVFSGIAIADVPLSERCCGVWVVNIQTGQTIAYLKFEDAVQEVFAVTVAPNKRYPDVIDEHDERINGSFILPDEALAQVSAALRDPVKPPAPVAPPLPPAREAAK